MEYFETLPDYSPNIRINSYDIPVFGEFCLSNLLMPAALCTGVYTFLTNGWLCEGSAIEDRPPVHRLAPSKPNEKRSSPTPLPPHFSPPPGYGTYLSQV